MTTLSVPRGGSRVVAVAGTSASAWVASEVSSLVVFAGGTSSGVAGWLVERTRDTAAARVAQLKVGYELTWQQLAELFGVSRRAVHSWAIGASMRRRNIDRLERLELALPSNEGDPASQHRWLFSGTPANPSPYSQLLRELAPVDRDRAVDLLQGTVEAPRVRGVELVGNEWQLPAQ